MTHSVSRVAGTEPLWDVDGDARPLDGDGNGLAEWDVGVDEYVR